MVPRWLRLGQQHRHYVSGVRSLVDIIDAIRKYHCKLPVAAQMDFVNNVAAHFQACEALGLTATSKHHFLEEMAGRPRRANHPTRLIVDVCIRLEFILPWIYPRLQFNFVFRLMPRLQTHGSPALQGCWGDESANFELKPICRTAHEAHWHARVLTDWTCIEDRRHR